MGLNIRIASGGKYTEDGIEYDEIDEKLEATLGLPSWGWSRPYSAFNRFRTRLAAEVGIDLDSMKGFGLSNARPWSEVDDDLVPLLDHSDCDGDLSPEEAKRVAPRLREIVSRWPEDDYDRESGEVLAGLLAAAGENGRRVLFQ
jgi:hypothetical protein